MTMDQAVSRPALRPFAVLNEQAVDAGIVLLCDHASALIPPDLADLGVDPAHRRAHVAWDIGAAKVTRHLSRWLNCPALLSGVSRLVVDCNRHPDDPSAIPPETCQVVVPGNAGLTADLRQDRLDQWFHPYHDAIAALLPCMGVPLVVSVHSFTPVMCDQTPRPWHIGVLWNRDTRLADRILPVLDGVGDLVVGRNQPYSGQCINYTLDRHAGCAGLPHVSFEIRQDLLADEYGCVAWGKRLADALLPLIGQTDLRTRLPVEQRLILD